MNVSFGNVLYRPVLAMLQKNRTVVFGGAGGDNALGNMIVGDTLSHTKGPEARGLFNALAVLPEGVPAPMAALEPI